MLKEKEQKSQFQFCSDALPCLWVLQKSPSLDLRKFKLTPLAYYVWSSGFWPKAVAITLSCPLAAQLLPQPFSSSIALVSPLHCKFRQRTLKQMTATDLVATEDAMNLQRVIIHRIPIKLGARTAHTVSVHAKVLRANCRFFITTNHCKISNRCGGQQLYYSDDKLIPHHIILCR